MATTQTPRGPYDRHAERVALAAGLYSAAWWRDTRQHHEPGDYFHVEHQQIAGALDQLDDIGPFIPTRSDWLDEWTGAHPLTPPTALTCRIAAVATITDLPAAPIQAVCKYADGLHEKAAAIVRTHADKRRQIYALSEQIEQLRDLTE